jgi:hypothetical protein
MKYDPAIQEGLDEYLGNQDEEERQIEALALAAEEDLREEDLRFKKEMEERRETTLRGTDPDTGTWLQGQHYNDAVEELGELTLHERAIYEATLSDMQFMRNLEWDDRENDEWAHRAYRRGIVSGMYTFMDGSTYGEPMSYDEHMQRLEDIDASDEELTKALCNRFFLQLHALIQSK